MTRILHDRIKDLHLNAQAPFPSEVFDAHELILQWRSRQRLHVVEPDRDDADYPVHPVDDGEVA